MMSRLPPVVPAGIIRFMVELKAPDDRSVISDEAPELSYRHVSGWAVGGLCGGALSALAMTGQLFWLIPPVAVAINVAALREVRRHGRQMIGRRAALAGLALALIFGLSAPLQGPIHRWSLRAAAIDLARQWFIALRENEPHKAHQLALPQWTRMPADEALVARYAEDKARRALANYIDQPAIGLLLRLGKRAQVRYYGNTSVAPGDEEEKVVDLYAVTVEQGGRRTSFFVKLVLMRRLDLLRRVWSWQVSTAEFVPSAPEQLAAK